MIYCMFFIVYPIDLLDFINYVYSFSNNRHGRKTWDQSLRTVVQACDSRIRWCINWEYVHFVERRTRVLRSHSSFQAGFNVSIFFYFLITRIFQTNHYCVSRCIRLVPHVFTARVVIACGDIAQYSSRAINSAVGPNKKPWFLFFAPYLK